MGKRTTLAARLMGLAAGGALAVGGVSLARVEEPQSGDGARLRLSATAGPDLRVDPQGTLLAASGIKPGSDAHALDAGVTVTNPARRSVRVRVLARGKAGPLDRRLHMEIAVRGERQFLGTLHSLRRTGSAPFKLAARRSAAGELRVWLPKSVRHGHRRRSTQLTLEWRRAG